MAVSQDAALAVAQKTRQQTTWSTLLVIVAVSLLAYFVARYVSQPFQNVVQAIRSYEFGKAGLDLPFDRNDEIGDLSRAFRDQVADLEISRNAERRTLERLQAILDNTVDGMITIDSKGAIQSFNRGAEVIFGFSNEEVIGQNVKILMSEPYHSQHDGFLRNYHVTHESKVLGSIRTVEGRRKDGRSLPLELSVSIVDTGTETVFSGIVRDISERRALEKKSRRIRKNWRPATGISTILQILPRMT